MSGKLHLICMFKFHAKFRYNLNNISYLSKTVPQLILTTISMGTGPNET